MNAALRPLYQTGYFWYSASMTLWFASSNEHKRKELASILNRSIVLPADRGLVFECEETGASFYENALIKARALYGLAGEAVIADDSGLCVDALDGRPGVYSARYAGRRGCGKKLESPERNALLLEELEGVKERSARFVCAMVLMLNENRFFLIQESLEGSISAEPSGKNGFGYDPLFYLPAEACTMAELSDERKNTLSHRGRAGRRMAALLESLNGDADG